MNRTKPEKTNITGLILAGGRGTRMGNVDKGLQAFRGMPMVKHVLMRLEPQVDRMIINANRNLSTYADFGIPVWSDEITGYAGPLAGLQTGLHHCETPYLVTVPCDTPFLPPDLVAQLSDALAMQQADLAIAVTGAGGSYQPHPVFCLLKASLLPHLEKFLQTGQRKVDAWYATLKVAKVHFDNEAAFRNINTQEELQRFQQP
jgi:molybdopterin-guanine dinucleotide biosynthesis protein A